MVNQNAEDEEKREKPMFQNSQNVANKLKCNLKLLMLIDRRHSGLIDHNLGKVALMHLGIHERAYLNESRSGRTW